MESNKQTELTSKNRDRLVHGEQMTATMGQGVLGVERLSKKEKGFMGMDNSVVFAGRRGY